MQYINTAKIRKLVAINREKRFVEPNEVINLSPIDIGMLGANAAFMKPYTAPVKNEVKPAIVEKEEKKIEAPAPKTVVEKKEPEKKAPAKKKSAKKKAEPKKKAEKKEKPVKKASKKKTSKKKSGK